jgi:hypothetical protein
VLAVVAEDRAAVIADELAALGSNLLQQKKCSD